MIKDYLFWSIASKITGRGFLTSTSYSTEVCFKLKIIPGIELVWACIKQGIDSGVEFTLSFFFNFLFLYFCLKFPVPEYYYLVIISSLRWSLSYVDQEEKRGMVLLKGIYETWWKGQFWGENQCYTGGRGERGGHQLFWLIKSPSHAKHCVFRFNECECWYSSEKWLYSSYLMYLFHPKVKTKNQTFEVEIRVQRASFPW